MSSYCMAVGAHQLALAQLLEQSNTGAIRLRDGTYFDKFAPPDVVEFHHVIRVAPAAVGAWFIFGLANQLPAAC